MMLFRKHLESCYATNPETGEKEFVEQLVDARKLKIYSDAVDKNNKMLMIETGQQLRLDEKWTEKALGVDGRGGVDYPALVQTTREWDAGAPLRAANRAQEKAARDQWFDEDWIQSLVRDGMARDAAERAVQRERDRKDGFSPAEVRSRHWERVRAADHAELVENLELVCEESVTQDLEGNPLRLDAEGLDQERARLKQVWFPDDEAAHVRIDQFFDNWRYPDAENVDEVPVVAASPNDEQTEEQDVDVEIVRMMPPRMPAEEPEAEPVQESAPEPEHDPLEPLREAVADARGDGVMDPDALMRRLSQDGVRFDVADFYAVLSELAEADAVA
jgi:hypothetical protein